MLVYVVMLQNKKKNQLWSGGMKECQFLVTLH